MPPRNIWSDIVITNQGQLPFKVMYDGSILLCFEKAGVPSNMRILYSGTRTDTVMRPRTADAMLDLVVERVEEFLCKVCHDRWPKEGKLGLCGYCYAARKRTAENRARRLASA